jgi:hypothetical protein
MKRIAIFNCGVLLAACVAAFPGSALAGNGNGNGNAGNDAAPPAAPAAGTASQSSAPGNSANAPGQVKKNSTSGTATTQSSSGGSVDQNANASVSGVKPTSSTAKGNKPTSCSTGGGTGTSATCTSTGSNAATAQTAAHADASKRYGNDTTAAQIANSRGAPSGTKLTGPGNSQPHKVAVCPRKTNRSGGVDVHAVKNYSSAQCVTTPTVSRGVTPTVTPTTKTTTVTPGANVTGAPTTSAGVAATTTTAAPTTQVTTPQGSVLGSTAAQGKPAGGVLGAIQAVGQGKLPFTGFPLWATVLGALGLLAFGLMLRHAGRATA